MALALMEKHLPHLGCQKLCLKPTSPKFYARNTSAYKKYKQFFTNPLMWCNGKMPCLYNKGSMVQFLIQSNFYGIQHTFIYLVIEQMVTFHVSEKSPAMSMSHHHLYMPRVRHLCMHESSVHTCQVSSIHTCHISPIYTCHMSSLSILFCMFH
jgi:hypothetical protein